MVEKKTARIRSKLDVDADKTALEISDNVYQKSIDKNLKMVGGINAKYLKEFYNYLITKGDKIRSLETKIKIIRYLNDFLSKEKRDAPVYYRNDNKKIQVITGKDFKEVERKDIEGFVASKRDLAGRTKEGYKIHIKSFFAWLYDCGEKEYPKVVSWIKTKNIQREFVEEYELISKDIIKELVKNCLYLRDRAMIMVLYDGALRVSELTNLKIKDVIDDEYGIKINIINGKTGSRKIRLVESVPVLKEWLNSHPFKEDREKNLFVCLGSNFGKPIVSQGAYKMIAKTTKRAGIKDKIHPHAFRHTRLTELAKQGYNETELRIFAGWAKNSDMPSVYLHYSEKDLDDKILRKNKLFDDKELKKRLKGIEEERKKLQPANCPQCKEKNDFNNIFCNRCGMILDLVRAERSIKKRKIEEKKIMKMGYTLKEMEQNPEFVKMFNNFLEMFKSGAGRYDKEELEKKEEESQEIQRFNEWEKLDGRKKFAIFRKLEKELKVKQRG